MVTVGIYIFLVNSVFYDNICLKIIKKLYKSSGKFDDQKQYKAIIESAMVSNNEALTANSLLSPVTPVSEKIQVQENNSINFLKL